MIQVDNSAKFITWADGKSFNTLSPQSDNEFLLEPDGLVSFFDGILTKKKPPAKAYICMRVHHSKEDNDKFLRKISQFTKDRNCAFNQCIVQAESMKNIGWLAYTTNYTDIEHLKIYLQTKSNFDWGFCLQPISDGDKNQNYSL